MKLKQCCRCGKLKAFPKFWKSKLHEDGYVSSCKDCNNERRRNSYAENPDPTLARNKVYADSHKKEIAEYLAKYGKDNRESLRGYHRDWSQEWRDKSPGKAAAKTQFYNASKLQQSPKWLTKEQLAEIGKIYANCPKGYHVDHILPLRGKDVRGLHVPWNLQYLRASENKSKGNRIK